MGPSGLAVKAAPKVLQENIGECEFDVWHSIYELLQY